MESKGFGVVSKTITLPRECADVLRQEADSKGWNLSTVILQLLRRYFEENPF